MKPCQWLVVLVICWSSAVCAKPSAAWICDSHGNNCIEMYDDSVEQEQLQQVVDSSDSAEAPIVLASHRKRQVYKKRYHQEQRPHNFPSSRAATGRRVFIFDPRNTTWAAYDDNGSLVRTGNASGGRHYCPDVGRRCLTPTGTFSVYSKGGAGCKSTKYPKPNGGAIMSHCMYFHGGYAIHGSNDVPNYNASHGCIRVQPAAAYWLNREFLNYDLP